MGWKLRGQWDSTSKITLYPRGVIDISRKGTSGCKEILTEKIKTDDCRLRLGDQIELKVRTSALTEIGTADILLWIGGNPVPGLKATRFATQDDSQFTNLLFQLPPQIGATGASSDAAAIAAKNVWMRVLGRPWDDRGVGISAGKIDAPLFTLIDNYKVERLDKLRLVMWGVFFGFLIVWLCWVAGRTGLLREEAIEYQEGAEMIEGKAAEDKAALDLPTLQTVAEAARVTANQASAALKRHQQDLQNASDAAKKRQEEADAALTAARVIAEQAGTALATPALQKANEDAIKGQQEADAALKKAQGPSRVIDYLMANFKADKYAQTRAYSLARTQMLVWTVIVAMSMVGIWQLTNNNDVIGVNVLILMGISIGTSLSAATIDRNKQVQAEPAKNVDTEAKKTLTNPQTYGFWADLMSDRNGPAVGRVQMVIFTMILMGMFIYDTVTTLVMPEFSATLLGLMGVTSATYVSFKIPEKKV